MTKFFLVRAVRAVFVVAVLVVITFLLSRSLGDPARIAVGTEASNEQYQQMREFLGQNDPALSRLASYLGDLAHGDFGTSTWQRVPAIDLVVARLSATLTLACCAVLLGLVVGVPLGFTIAAAKRRAVRSVASAIPLVLVSLAEFWVGIMLILIFSVKLDLLPTSGSGGITHLILPAATLAMVPIGQTAAMVSVAVPEELAKRYVVALRAKGLNERQVLLNHVLRNVAPTFLTMLGYEFVYVFTGAAVLVETVFQWPGIGKLAVDAVLHSDVVLISAIVVVTGILVAVINTIVDIAHFAIDRRLHLGA